MRRLCVILAIVLAAQAAAAQTRGYHVVRKPRAALALTGAALLLSGYALAFVTAFTPEAHGEAWCAAPLVGPWVAAARDASGPADDLLFVTQGLVELTGVVLLIAGLVPREVRVGQIVLVPTGAGVFLRF